jgi:proteasome beta subunit
VALKYPGGVVMAGDRRATQGHMIASRDVQKVYITDDYTVTGIAGTAAIAVEFARLYAVELEHYEKIEGVALTFPGKVNRLATMVRGNLGAALQGFVALPLLAGYDLDDPNAEGAGRIVSFDAAGGWNIEEEGYQSVDEEALLTGQRRRFRAARRDRGALRCRRRRLGDRRSRPGTRDLPDRRGDRRRRRSRHPRAADRRDVSCDHRESFAGRHIRPRRRASR